MNHTTNHFDPVDILLVEDNPLDVEMLIRALKKHNLSNKLYVAKDGVEALDFIFCREQYAEREIDSPPKVIFLDLKLPKMNGLEVLERVKADERTRLIPVVMVTSSGEELDIKTAYALGANSYVVKPVQFDAFEDTMGRLGLYWLLANELPR